MVDTTTDSETGLEGTTGHLFQNWSKTFECRPEVYFEPTTVDEIRLVLELALQQNKKVKVAGGGHSPSDITCTTGYMMSLRKFNKILNVDKEKKQVTVQAGITLSELQEQLKSHGLAISLLPSVADITVAGVVSTGTHGTGANYGILATSVTELTLLTGTLKLVHCSAEENIEIFQAARCGLGAMGVILDITWQCEDVYKLESVRKPALLDDVLDSMEEQMSKTEHFRFHWWPHTNKTTVWNVDRTDKPIKTCKSWFWNYLVGYHVLQFAYWISSFFPWLNKYINHYHHSWLMSDTEEIVEESEKVFTFNCLFQQYVTDWAIPREKTAFVLRKLKKWLDESGVYVHLPAEVRFCKADDILVSPAYGRDTCFINIIMYRPYGKDVNKKDYWNFYEDLMLSVGGRPHWAKAHKLGPEMLQKLYPRFDDFRNICTELDPERLFLNDYLERVVFGGDK